MEKEVRRGAGEVGVGVAGSIMKLRRSHWADSRIVQALLAFIQLCMSTRVSFVTAFSGNFTPASSPAHNTAAPSNNVWPPLLFGPTPSTCNYNVWLAYTTTAQVRPCARNVCSGWLFLCCFNVTATSQGQVCLDKCTSCHTEIQHRTCYLTKS